MAAMSGPTLLVAMCLLHLTVHVEAGLTTLKKPTKHDYTVEIEKVEMISTPTGDYLDPKSRFYSELYNDTARVVNADFYVLKDLPEDLLTQVHAYILNSRTNQWNQIYKQEAPLIDLIKRHSDFVEVIYLKGNVTREWPVPKGYYYVRNYMQGTEGFALHVEEDYWRVELDCMTKNSRETLFAVRIEAWTRPIEDDE